MKKYKSDRAFDIVNGLIIAILCVTFILPFWMMIISSFTEEISLRVNGYKLFPSAFSAAGYEYIFSSSDYNILRAIINSVIISVSGTVLSVAVSLITAYALSKKYVVGIKGINVFYIITMFFAGGTIPLYLVIRGIGLYDTIWALIIPSMFSLYHIILVRSYFYSLPAALEEAAMIDGATCLERIWHVNLPSILPTVTIMLVLQMGGLMSVGHEKALLMQNALNLEASELVSTYVYKIGLKKAQYSLSTAVDMLNSIVNVVLMLSMNWVVKKIGQVSAL